MTITNAAAVPTDANAMSCPWRKSRASFLIPRGEKRRAVTNLFNVDSNESMTQKKRAGLSPKREPARFADAEGIAQR
jgi:hypothetical protein